MKLTIIFALVLFGSMTTAFAEDVPGLGERTHDCPDMPAPGTSCYKKKYAQLNDNGREQVEDSGNAKKKPKSSSGATKQ